MISVLVPAHNEQHWLPACLDSIEVAAARVDEPVETVVCLNRCTDATESIARERGAMIVREDAKNLSKIRNAAAGAARGDTLVTIDADSRISPGMLAEVRRRLATGRVIGGGVARVYPDRWSLGIICSGLLVAPFVFCHRVSCGMFWTRASDFWAIGGFNEELVSVEDVDFAVRLKRQGKAGGKRFGHIWREHLTTSCRKFDWFGDWFLFKNPTILWRAFKGNDQEIADRIWYKARRK